MSVHHSTPADASVTVCSQFNLSSYVTAGQCDQWGSLGFSVFCLLVKCSRDRWHNDLPEFICSKVYFWRPNSNFLPSYWVACTVAADSSHSRQIVATLPRQALQRENRSINLPLMLKTWWENIRRTLSWSVTVAVLRWKWPEFITGCIYWKPAACQVRPGSYCQ